MDVPLIQIDAFATEPFEGNPAAVMPLPRWLDDTVLQQLAAENNLAETAFYTTELPAGIEPPEPSEPAFHLRWFTPAIEVELCGHATLAAAAQIFEDDAPDAERLWFHSLSGWLSVTRSAPGQLVLDFPAATLTPLPLDDVVSAVLGVPVLELYQSMDLVCVVGSAAQVAGLTVDLQALARWPQRGVIVTAVADQTLPGFDFVSRFFAARAGAFEDPVTGSAHTQLAPFWSARLGRNPLRARQLSPRGGTVDCEIVGARVKLGGGYRRYLDGVAHLG